MSLLSLNDDFSSPITPDGKNDVIFELPSLDSMKTNDKTEGFVNYITTHGNSELNSAVDKMTEEKTETQNFFYGSIDESDGFGIQNLLNIENKASKTDIAETLFAMKLLENINLEIKQTEEEIEKYKEIKEKLTKAINDLMS